jgi:hypothetical protein
MSRGKRGAKRKRLKRALGVAGASLLVAGGASAAATMQAPYAGSNLLYDEEVCDVSLATFYYFDRENITLVKGGGAGGAGTGSAAATCSCARPALTCRCHRSPPTGCGQGCNIRCIGPFRF